MKKIIMILFAVIITAIVIVLFVTVIRTINSKKAAAAQQEESLELFYMQKNHVTNLHTSLKKVYSQDFPQLEKSLASLLRVNVDSLLIVDSCFFKEEYDARIVSLKEQIGAITQNYLEVQDEKNNFSELSLGEPVYYDKVSASFTCYRQKVNAFIRSFPASEQVNNLKEILASWDREKKVEKRTIVYVSSFTPIDLQRYAITLQQHAEYMSDCIYGDSCKNIFTESIDISRIDMKSLADEVVRYANICLKASKDTKTTEDELTQAFTDLIIAAEKLENELPKEQCSSLKETNINIFRTQSKYLSEVYRADQLEVKIEVLKSSRAK